MSLGNRVIQTVCPDRFCGKDGRVPPGSVCVTVTGHNSVEVAHAPGAIRRRSAHKYAVPSITCSVDLVIVLFRVGNTCHTLCCI